jgi:hypothetical protein
MNEMLKRERESVKGDEKMVLFKGYETVPDGVNKNSHGMSHTSHTSHIPFRALNWCNLRDGVWGDTPVAVVLENVHFHGESYALSGRGEILFHAENGSWRPLKLVSRACPRLAGDLGFSGIRLGVGGSVCLGGTEGEFMIGR